MEALGRSGRWERALSVLKEGATAARKEGLRLDAACFVPALRACCRCAKEEEEGVEDAAAAAGAAAAADDASASSVLTPSAKLAVRGNYLDDGQAPRDRELSQHREQHCEPLFVGPAKTEERRGDGWARHRGDMSPGDTVATVGNNKCPSSEGGRKEGDDTVRADKVVGDGVPEEEEGGRLRDATLLLRRMESEAGVVPDAWGVNVVIEARSFCKPRYSYNGAR